MSEAAVDQQTYEEELKLFCAEHLHDPLGFVMGIYPWGQEGTALEDWDGPDEWQTKVLVYIGKQSAAGKPVRLARASGHGIGKTALISWIIHWFNSTRSHPQTVVTANTKTQLTTKTWRELAKWQTLALNGHWFDHSGTKYTYIAEGELIGKTWFASAVAWTKEKSEAFAGTHEKHVLMLFDEGSAVDDKIYEVAEGAMTTPGAMFIVFGNPTMNTGRFHRIFHLDRKWWNIGQIDSRDTKVATRDEEVMALYKMWEEAYGEDSDFFRVRCKGQFPRRGVVQFIPSDVVEAAAKRRYGQNVYRQAPKILGVDVARYGDDQSVIIKRQGLAAYDLEKYREIDTMRLSNRVATIINEWNPDAVFIDGVGVGAGVVDRLRELKYRYIIDVNGGNAPSDPDLYFNLRSEMWGKMKDWLILGGLIPNDQELTDDLVGPEYGYNPKGQIQLETKKDMKLRDLPSPDSGDALGFTFASPVNKRDDRLEAIQQKTKEPYDPRSHFSGKTKPGGRARGRKRP